MTENAINLSEAEKLTIFRIGLENSMISIQQIENWALKTFTQSNGERIDYILELCSAVRLGINKILGILIERQALPQSNPAIKQILYGIAGMLYEQHKIDLVKSCYFVTAIARNISNETEYDLFATGLDDVAFLASQGMYGSLEETEKDFLAITDKYKSLAEIFFQKEFYIE